MELLDGGLLKDAFINAAIVLEMNKKHVDALNVFPVPDGDTGTNMSLTMNAAIIEINKVNSKNVYDVAIAASNGALRGARGNSGVILSQLLRGFARGLEGFESINATQLSHALMLGSETAYKAVMKPTEGTILTVAREGADYAVKSSTQQADIVLLLKDIITESEKVLERTPNMLPILKESGVVDAGGKGLIIILVGMLNAISGKMEKYELRTINDEIYKSVQQYEQDILYTYCTEFIINNNKEYNEEQIIAFRNTICEFGDSVMVVGDKDIIKVHIHTNNPNKIIEQGLFLGQLSNIKIDNMKEQHRNTINIDDKSSYKDIGIVAVAMGNGIKDVFKDLGVDLLISGGQTMNPSTEDIVTAIEKLNCKNVLILPNNSNVILSAQQATHFSSSNVYVIPTKSISQGIASMLAFDSESSVENNVEKMSAAILNVKTGQITYAVRDSKLNGSDISEGDILGINEKEICVIQKNIEKAALELLEAMVDDGDEIITLFYGENIELDDAKKLEEKLKASYPECDIELYDGGQPIFYYIISIE